MANQPVAFAATTQPSSLQKINVEERNAVGLEEFKNYISKFFNNPEEYTLYDKSGNDISDEFYEKYDRNLLRIFLLLSALNRCYINGFTDS